MDAMTLARMAEAVAALFGGSWGGPAVWEPAASGSTTCGHDFSPGWLTLARGPDVDRDSTRDSARDLGATPGRPRRFFVKPPHDAEPMVYPLLESLGIAAPRLVGIIRTATPR